MKNPFSGRGARAAVFALTTAAFAAGCCDGLSIRLSRMVDFLSGVVGISGSVSADVAASDSAFASVVFSGDFAGFADIPAFPSDEVETDLSGATWLGGGVAFDMDYDASDEDVTVLFADVPSPGADVVFSSWRGDAYTADKGVCYLGWAESGEARLAATWCGEESGLMFCSMPAGVAGAAPSCERCDAQTGSCTACDMSDRLKSCLPKKSASGSVDIDIDIDIDFDHDGELSVDSDADGAL